MPSRFAAIAIAPCLLTPCLLILASCASVSVRKVPAATTYTNWTDADQRRADALEGVRFYMPRPYVRVKQPFIVAADVYLAHAIVAPDGGFALLTSITSLDPAAPRAPALPSELARSIPLRSIPLRAIAARPSAPPAPASGGDIALGISDELDPQLAAAAKSAVELLTAPVPAPADPASTPTTGREHRRVAVDNTALARTPLDGPFDILYLPDFDEQYVVSSSAKLGDTAVALDLGQGWSLQSLDSLADNRAINQRIYALLDDVSRLGLAAARAAIMGPLPNIALSADPTDPNTDATSADPTSTDSDPAPHVAIPATPAHDAPPAPGTPLLLRITVLHTVAPGLYPVIKPRELAAASSRPGTFNLSLATGSATKSISARTTAPAPRHATTPIYPYAHISFSTVQTLVIEQP
jgi:hypothetical protein